MKTETSPSNSEVSNNTANARGKVPTWIKVGTVAAASALAGGLAAVWFYRKTLLGPQNGETATENSNFRISTEEHQDDE
jgi:hypothetical protein